MGKDWVERKRFWGSVGLILLVALWLYGLQSFLQKIPTDLQNATEKTDAIVVLTGGKDRLPVAIELLIAHKARKLLITGVDRQIQTISQLNLPWPKNYDPSCCVELGYRAEDTYGNAIETAHWVKQNQFTSIRLVTAAYHMPRSLLEFQAAMPGVTIVPHPVFLDHVRIQEWWRWPGTAWLIASEYSKYILAQFGHAVIAAYFDN